MKELLPYSLRKTVRLSFPLFILVHLAPAFAQQQPVKIGVSVDLSSEAVAYGTDIKNTILFANRKLAGGKYQLVIEDDKCSGKDAVTVAQKLVTVDKVAGVLGFACSGALLAAAPVYERAKTVVISSSSSSAAVSSAGDYIFRTVPSDSLVAKVLYSHVRGKHRRFGIITEETDYAQTLTQAFIEENTGGALELERKDYLPKTQDFRTMIIGLRQKGVTGIFLNAQAEPTLAVLAKQIREMNWPVALYAVYYPGSPAFLSVAGSAAEGIEYADVPSADEVLTPEGKKVFQEFVAQYGPPKSTDCFFVMAYAAFAALDRALQSGGDVKEYLYQHPVDSIYGTFSFDARGDIVGFKHVMRVIKNGKPQRLGP